MKHTETAFLAALAARQGVSLAKYISATQEAIDAAWDNPDPQAAAFRRRLFPEGKPSPALFIARLANCVRADLSDTGTTT